MGQYQKALTDFDKAIALGGDHYNTRGFVLSNLGRYEEALRDYEYELKKNPSSPNILYNIAVVMVRWKGLPDAQSYVEKARQALLPLLDTDERRRGLYCLGSLEALCNNNEQALDYLQQVVLLGKGDVVDWARHDIAWATLRATDERFRALLASA